MKNIFLVCAAAFFLFSCKGKKEKEEKNSLSIFKLKGKVKSLTQSSYSATGDSGQASRGNLFMTFDWKFDEKGNFIEKKSKRTGDSIVHFQIYRYDTAEHLLLDSSNEYKDHSWDIYLYDLKGNQIERLEHYSDSGKTKIGITEIYKVDEKGNKIEEDCYWGNKDSLNYKAYIKNNERGQELEKVYYDEKGKLHTKVVRVYDDKGNQLEFQIYNCDTLKNKYTWKWDNRDNEIESCNYKKDGKLASKDTWKYDDKGFMIEDDYIGTASSRITRHFTYYENIDKEGNWHRSIELMDGKPESIVERVIEYYP